MKTFNLEKALAGEKVITRDNREVDQLVSFDVQGSDFTVYAVLDDGVDSWTKSGGFCSNGSDTHPNDLFMAVELVDGKAYQFDWTRVSGEVGCYNLEFNRFYTAYGERKFSECTNIKLLEVKS